MKPKPGEAERIHPPDARSFRAWLRANHARTGGVWVVSYRKDTGLPRMSYEESVEVALCFGWIDSKPARLDARRSMLWFSPRRRGSGWSLVNKRRIGRLAAAGLLHASGLAKIAAAKADGSWTKLDKVGRLVVPADLRKALAGRPGATRHFDGFPPSSRKLILEWIASAKKPETRARRVDETARLAQLNRRANHWRG